MARCHDLRKLAELFLSGDAIGRRRSAELAARGNDPGLPSPGLRLDEARFLRVRGKLASDEQRERAHDDSRGDPHLSLSGFRLAIDSRAVTAVPMTAAAQRNIDGVYSTDASVSRIRYEPLWDCRYIRTRHAAAQRRQADTFGPSRSHRSGCNRVAPSRRLHPSGYDRCMIMATTASSTRSMAPRR
jgi:hypothetical protein